MGTVWGTPLWELPSRSFGGNSSLREPNDLPTIHTVKALVLKPFSWSLLLEEPEVCVNNLQSSSYLLDVIHILLCLGSFPLYSLLLFQMVVSVFYFCFCSARVELIVSCMLGTRSTIEPHPSLQLCFLIGHKFLPIYYYVSSTGDIAGKRTDEGPTLMGVIVRGEDKPGIIIFKSKSCNNKERGESNSEIQPNVEAGSVPLRERNIVLDIGKTLVDGTISTRPS